MILGKDRYQRIRRNRRVAVGLGGIVGDAGHGVHAVQRRLAGQMGIQCHAEARDWLRDTKFGGLHPFQHRTSSIAQKGFRVHISQALIAIGGKARRIREEGVDVPISKSFIPVHGKPLLYWNLLSLRAAGVKRIILCADHPLQLQEAEVLLGGMSDTRFSDVKFFQDPGLGVHGLPYQVLAHEPAWLDEDFVFECGHSLMMPEHYRLIMNAKDNENIVFSLFESHPANRRQPVVLSGDRVYVDWAPCRGRHALAHPMVVDTAYASQLPFLGFDIGQILREYATTARLTYVPSEMPPEFDVLAEMRSVLPLYETYLAATPLEYDAQYTVRRTESLWNAL